MKKKIKNNKKSLSEADNTQKVIQPIVVADEVELPFDDQIEDQIELEFDNLKTKLPVDKLAKSKIKIENLNSLQDLPGSDPLKVYLKQISQYKLLTPEKEKELTLLLFETGDIEAARQLVLANLRLVVKIAMEYRYSYKNLLDLIQEGNIGLMKAVSKFNPHMGAKLSYYASWWIRSYILKFILDNFRLIKIGTTQDQKKLFYNLMREKEKLLAQGINPDTKLLSTNLDVSEKSVLEMDHRLGQNGSEISIDKAIFDGDTKLGDTLSSQDEPIDDQLAQLQNLDILKNHLHQFLDTLKPRDREIFQKRLLDEVPESLQGIANQYGVSRERIRQVESRLIDKLRIYMNEYIR